ncbi:MAG: Hsp20/alpha crystallin family protein [Candidatus Paceibacterota bacterium]|jgi:HSP20 family protein
MTHKNKRSFFERLTGAKKNDWDDVDNRPLTETGTSAGADDETEGQLAVDVHQDESEIIVRAFIAGVKPENLDIVITREMVTVKGKRERPEEISNKDYFIQELYWGSFARTIMLPQEIDADGAEAVERHGLLTIRLPKLDKHKTKSVRVKSI